MTPAIIIITILAYFATILAISWFTGRKADNAGFFSGNRKQSWHVVAFAMIGSAMSCRSASATASANLNP